MRPVDEAAQEMFEASSELQEALIGLRESPALQNTWGELLLRSILAHPSWVRMRTARKKWEKAR